ncbi:MAG TPA: VOC family protein [Pelagibacterium sp.]|uniref:VOC family protein n=1 Tax=Pelagibacterium sp. TaxID=1967288 RepID=UPI002CF85C73|nr:VOC family protein [Pelagibacterium sp.]HWJ87109.1 VOC family protein [Pelagibacterium sp.]
MSDVRPFHLAFPVTDLEATRTFYRDVMGCRIGREKPGHWVDFDLYGHQLSAHLRPQGLGDSETGTVDGDAVPIPHFGVVLRMDQWTALADRLKADPGTRWVLEPKIRFEGQPGEQGTMFILDPSGNPLEFKGFASDEGIFEA